MNGNADDTSGEGATPSSKAAWLSEIIRETEHYYQGEDQHEQRASWLLATAGLLIAVLASMAPAAVDKHYEFTLIILAVALVMLALSAIISIITLQPLRGTRRWGDPFGRLYRRERQKEPVQLIEERFRVGQTWSTANYELRLIYHFRSHYLRFMRKAYGILWSTRFLILGVACFVAVGISILFPTDILEPLIALLAHIVRRF